MMFNKYMLVVSAGTDVRDGRALARLLRAAEPERAAIRGEGVLDVLDHAAAETGYGGKLALDLTGLPEGEVPPLAVPGPIVPAGGIAAWSMEFYPEWGVAVLFAPPGAEADVAAFVRTNCPQARIRGWTAPVCCGWRRPIPTPGAIFAFATVCCWPMHARNCRAGPGIPPGFPIRRSPPRPFGRSWMHAGRSMA